MFKRIAEIPQLLTIYATGLMMSILSRVIAILRRGTIMRNALRSTRKGLQTAVVTYNHPEDYTRVVLVGAMHVADRPYFEELKTFVDEEHDVNKSVILYEAVRKSPNPPEDDNSATAILQRAFGNLRKAYTYMAACTGKAFQPDVLTEEDHWINTDMTQREVAERSAKSWLIRFLYRTGLLWLAMKFFRLVDIPEPPDKPDFSMSMQIDNGMRSQHLSVVMGAPLSLIPKEATPIKTILYDRNELAVEMILGQTVHHDHIVSIWGAAHLPGMGKLLEENGYVRSKDVKWFTCSRFRRYGIFSIIRYVLSGQFKTK